MVILTRMGAAAPRQRWLSRTVSLLAIAALTLGLSASNAEPISTREAVQPLTAKELLATKGLSGLRVSPDGKYAVVRVDSRDLASNTTNLNWYRIRLSDGQATWIGDAGEPLWSVNGALDTVAPQWSADGKLIYYRGVRDKQAQVWRLNAEGSEQEPVTSFAADVQGFILNGDGSLLVATDPATRAEIHEAERAEYDNGVLMDKTIIPGFPLFGSFPINGRMAALRSILPTLNRNWGRATLLGNQPLKVFKRDGGQATFHDASAEEAERFAAWWDHGGYDQFDPQPWADGQAKHGDKSATLDFLMGDAAKGLPVSRSRFYLRSTDAKGTTTVCASDLCTDADGLSMIGWSADGAELIFQTSDAIYETLRAWNVQTNRVRTILKSGGMLGSHLSGTGGSCQISGSSRSTQSAICILSAADTPPRLVSVDLATGSPRVLFDPNPNLTSDRLGRAEKIVLKDRWGGTTSAFLVLPRSWLALEPAQRARLPLVITSYSCSGFLKGGSGDDVPEHVLAGRGYAAVCADFGGGSVRSAPGWDIDADNNNYKQMQDFFESAAQQLTDRGVVDSSRVVISGFSGSSAGVAYTIQHSAKFTAAIVTTESFLDPISCQLAGNLGGCRQVTASMGFKPPYDSPDGRYKDISPAWNAAKISTPLLMQLPIVEYPAMMQLHTALQDFDRAVDMYIFADEYHSKHQPRHMLAVYERNLAWIDFWLKGEDPVDRARDELPRWRGFREKQCALFHSGQGNMNRPWYCAT